MFALLASLVAIYSRLGGGKSDASLMEKVAVQLPFSVYFGWITVAAAANAAAALSFVGWISWTVNDAVLGVAATAVVLVAALTVTAAHKRRRLGSSHHMGSCEHSLESEFSTIHSL